MNFNDHVLLAMIDFALGLFILWRGFVNANNMNDGKRTHRGIMVLNLMLAVAGLALALSPLYGEDASRWAHVAALSAFVVCMFIGRRPTDRVLCP